MARTRNTNTKVQAIADEEVEVMVEEVPSEDTFSAKDLANELDIDAKTFRRWLRAHTQDRANKGGRWIFTAEAKATILEAYRTKPATEVTLADADA